MPVSMAPPTEYRNPFTIVMNDPAKRYDLHTHSRASDGYYTPTELVKQAHLANIDFLALTDHDSTEGIREAMQASRGISLEIIAGTEISVTWQKKVIHLVGLNIDPENHTLKEGLMKLQKVRLERAQEMGLRLEKSGLPGLFEAAREMAGDGMITRTHFAHQIMRLGLASEVRDVFRSYLTPGKPGYVSTQWATLEEAVNWVQAAGGVTVIAHPQRYRLTQSLRQRLLGEFRELGGTAIEVLSGSAPPQEVQASVEWAKRHDLMASCGSDFHDPRQGWPKLGRLPNLPTGLTPVWSAWE
jgi:predicted metal-dependent phosphoesterase TrpH